MSILCTFRVYPYEDLKQIGNYMSAEDWNLEDGYQTFHTVYPFRLIGGKYVGDIEFSIVIYTEDIENVCTETPTTLVNN